MGVMNRKILVAEDYEDAREFMKFLLQSYGYQVIEAADGLEAVERIKTEFPDLVLMDMAMPVMDGIAATKAIRKLKEGAVVPIIAITAHGKRFYDRAIEAGCNDLIEKPVDFDSFEAVLNQYLEM
jgi:two-component system cell cycle response regulator DivK